MPSGSPTTSYYAGRSAQLELHRPSLPPVAVRGASWIWTRFVRPCRRRDSVRRSADPMMSTSWLHSTTTSSTAFSIVFYHYASTIVARVRPTRGLTRNAAMQRVLHAGWNVRTSDSDQSARVASAKTTWYDQRRKYRQLRCQKCTDFWHDKIDADRCNPR